MTRAELDARKAAPAYAEGANPLMYLAEIFNNYDEFKPQNLMVKYASSGVNQPPVKVTPYQPRRRQGRVGLGEGAETLV